MYLYLTIIFHMHSRLTCSRNYQVNADFIFRNIVHTMILKYNLNVNWNEIWQFFITQFLLKQM